MLPEVIKDKATYERTLDAIDSLMENDPAPTTAEGKRLELLVHLVESYEKQTLTRVVTDPIDAIRFRMEQSNLKQSDLVPFMGSRSKVSEVLAGKRPLTLNMIQALHSGLGIPAESLLLPLEHKENVDKSINWASFPIKEMCNRGWFNAKYETVKNNAESYLLNYFSSLVNFDEIYQLNRSSTRSGRQMNRYSLMAWTARVVEIAKDNPPKVSFTPNSLNLELMRKIARLSVLPDGPFKAKNILKEHGVSLVIEPCLPKTYLDGSAIMMFEDHPIIGLTLRYDRVDNFWYSLMHELSHISLHFDKGINQFYDDLDVAKNEDKLEVEADEQASEALIPRQLWQSSPARVAPSKNTILRFARQIDIHPAIVAGRVRKERNSYHLFNDLVGHGRIRYLFGMEGENND